MHRKLIALTVLALAVVFFWSTLSHLAQAGLVLPSLLPGNKYRPLERLTPPPSISKVEVPYGSNLLAADLYMPTNTKPNKALLLVSGASVLGKDDPRIVNFGKTFARVGVAVLIPDFPDITYTKLDPQSVDEIVSAYQYLLKSFPALKTGMAAFSVATGPMFLASTEPLIKSNIDFLISFGGYYDLKDILRSDATEERNADPTVLPEIEGIFKTQFGDTPSFKALMDNTDPAKFDELYNALPEEVKSFINEMSIDGHTDDVGAKKIFLIHSDPDPDVPTIESEKLKDAFGKRADLTTLKSFSHTDVDLVPLSPETLVNFYTPEIFKVYKMVFKVLDY